MWKFTATVLLSRDSCRSQLDFIGIWHDKYVNNVRHEIEKDFYSLGFYFIWKIFLLRELKQISNQDWNSFKKFPETFCDDTRHAKVFLGIFEKHSILGSNSYVNKTN